MPFIIMMIAVGLILVVQKIIYTHFWDKNLSASVSIQDNYMIEGQETEITEVLSNAKWLPLPWIQLKFEIFRNGKTDNLFRADLFNILFHQRITRRSKLKLTKRGVYQIKSLDLLSFDMLISRKLYTGRKEDASITVFPMAVDRDLIQIPYEKLMGSITTRRYTLEDPFLFKGIRDYQEGDRFKDINFNATAKAGHLLVNTHEYTLDQRVLVILLTDKASSYFDEGEYEMGLRYGAQMIANLERSGIPTAFISNGLDSLENNEIFVEAGCSEGHIDSILEAMARIDLFKTGLPGDDMLMKYADEPEVNAHYVIISPCRTENILQAFQILNERTEAAMFISPVAKRSFFDMAEKEQNLEETLENFYFFKI